ncbi:hypothetical protein [Haloarchaeobius sp. HME9146]|uniref:hypothetical protein n=1 Tax=Haloarchaeobius sp. HME9146 TaxID=2978732 RepID=UPI0021C1ABF5|nr:hypothetical protein [Haloarchaeobius sp. HME9146]MCT9098203.1 hypothetical protein [Haloarchaeobius sp. HME9146]
MMDLLIGLGIGGFLLFVGTASWYHPTLFLVLFDRFAVDPWPQLLFTPAAYLGGLFLTLTLGLNLYFVQAFVGLAIGAAILLRHERNPRNDDDIWPSRPAGKGVLGIGGLFVALGLVAMSGLL